MGTDRRAELEESPEGAVYCARHPDVETYLRCGRCGTAICPRCLVQSPVGARCPDCARSIRVPSLELGPMYIARGIAAALVAGAAIGGFWGYALGRGFFGFFMIFIALGIGWAVSEAVSWATNHKRGPALQAMAVGGVILAYVVRNVVVAEALFVRGDLFGYIAVAIAAVFASSRLKGW